MITSNLENRAKELNAKFKNEFGLKLCQNIVEYVRVLPRQKFSSIIDKNIFTAQMSKIFNITGAYTIERLCVAITRSELPPYIVYVDDYCELLLTFMSTNTIKRADLVFDVFSGKGLHITKFEVRRALKETLGMQSIEEDEREEYLNNMTRMVMEATDVNQDGIIVREEFRDMAVNS